MAIFEWCILCTRVIEDSASKALSLIDILDNLRVVAAVPGPVQVPTQLAFIASWRRSDLNVAEHLQARCVLEGPTGEPIAAPMEYDVDLEKFPRLRVGTSIPGFTVNGSGGYRFIVQTRSNPSEEWAVAGEVLLTVQVVTPTSQ